MRSGGFGVNGKAGLKAQSGNNLTFKRLGNVDFKEAINSGRVPRFADDGLVGAPSLTNPNRSAPSAPAQVITIAPQVTVQAAGGTPEQNADLAKQTGRQVEAVVRQIVDSELRTQMRPGGLFR